MSILGVSQVPLSGFDALDRRFGSVAVSVEIWHAISNIAEGYIATKRNSTLFSHTTKSF